MSTKNSIRVRNATVSFGSIDVVRDIEWAIDESEIVSLIGPSGCGKTTLLRCLAGLQQTTQGDVVFESGIDTASGEIGFVFQQPSLLPWLSALENVMLPLQLIGQGTAQQRRSAAEDALASVQLSDHLGKRPGELSGGMQMRTSIARALVTNPSVLLLDEPFAALDDMLRAELGELLLTLWQRRQFTAVLVTHNISESILLSHRIAIMRDGVLERVMKNPIDWPRSWNQMRSAEFAEFFGVVSDRLRGLAESAR
ncbi:MAG: ABC transporter ATP-binding protein [Planctomycetota bacterium]